MKRVRFKPISYVGMVLMAIGVFGDRVLNINNQLLEYALIVLAIVGLALAIKGKEIYKA